MKAPEPLSAFFHCHAPANLDTALWKITDWERLIQAAEQHLVLPELFSRLNHAPVSSQRPAEVADFLSSVETLNGERNQAIFDELTHAALLLNSVGIEPVLLKGAAYCATGVYQNPACRYLWDVDLLIPESQLADSLKVLKQNNFEPEESYQLGHFRHHHPPIQRKGAIHFELHHSLGMGVCKSLLPASEVIANSTALDFQGSRVRVPSPEHLAVHLIMHSQIQHPYNERIWPTLRAMVDLVALRRRFETQINWPAVQVRFYRAGQGRVLALHLLQVHDTLGSETPFPIRLTALTRLCWLRRKLLRALPGIRFADPFYMYSTVLVRRLRLLRSALGVPGGWKYLARELFAPNIYKRLLTDIIEGHGR